MSKHIELIATVEFDAKAGIYRAAFDQIPNMTAYDKNEDEAREKLVWLLKTWIDSDFTEVARVFTRIMINQNGFKKIEFENKRTFIEEKDNKLQLAVS